MNDEKMQNFDIETENLGVVDIMWIQQGRILKKLLSISEINLKKMLSGLINERF